MKKRIKPVRSHAGHHASSAKSLPKKMEEIFYSTKYNPEKRNQYYFRWHTSHFFLLFGCSEKKEMK